MSSDVGVGVGVRGAIDENERRRKKRGIDRRVRVCELVLRSLTVCLGVVSVVLVATDSQAKHIFSITKTATFTDLKALVLLVVANGIASAYSVVQLLRCAVSMAKGTVLFNKPLAWAIFSGDQLMAYLTLAAVAATLQASVFSKLGQPELQWMKVCTMYGKFCNQVGEGIASAFIATIAMVIVSGISAFSLFRLYSGNKGKYSARW